MRIFLSDSVVVFKIEKSKQTDFSENRRTCELGMTGSRGWTTLVRSECTKKSFHRRKRRGGRVEPRMDGGHESPVGRVLLVTRQDTC